MENLFFEIIQVALGNRNNLSRVPSADEWRMLYTMASKQAVVGVSFCGVQRLPKEQVGNIPSQLKLKWFALTEKIKQRNQLLNRKCAEIYKALTKEGFVCAILKGQGIVGLYNLNSDLNISLYRQSGDIDVWLWKEGCSLKETRKKRW